MVSRKTSLPCPTSPPPPPPPEFGPSQINHNVDSSDFPPLPVPIYRGEMSSPYGDIGNPWDEEPRDQQDRAKSRLPDILKPANGQVMTSQMPITQDTPDIMKPGWSGENTPRSSIDSQRSKDFWESSDEEKDENKSGKQKERPKKPDPRRKPEIPASLQIKRKPIPSSPPQSSNAFDGNSGFASTNPFRRAPASGDGLNSNTEAWAADYKGKGKEAVRPHTPPTEQLTGLNLGGPVPDLSEYSSGNMRHDDAHWDTSTQAVPLPPSVAPPPIPSQDPPPIPEVSTPFSSQPPLIPVSPNPNVDEGLNPWNAQQSLSSQPSPIPFQPDQKQTSEYSENLLDRGEHNGSVFLGDELRSLPNHAPHTSSQTSLLDEEGPVPELPERSYKKDNYEMYAPPPGPPPTHMKSQQIFEDYSPPLGPPPMKPPRPAVVTKISTEAEIAQMQKQRNETYHIKHFNWFDQRLGKMRTSSMLTQNNNGPCPLLALVNALILGANDHDQAALDEFLRTREQVTLGTIIENLMVELLSAAPQGELPDVDELNRFLLRLTTGMNMNPRLVPPPAPPPNLMDARNSILHFPNQTPQDQPGTFEPTQDIKLYSAFGIQTVHGWLAEPGSDAAAAFSRSAQSYEDAQAKLFGEDELEYKLSNNGLTAQEQAIWEDIISIKNFLNNYQSQLTPYGLECIQSSLLPGSFAILFRNDHFSTIYKHPRTKKLYTLVTDAGYHDRDEIIWESLIDISGQNSEFLSGDFQSVSHTVSSRRGSSRRQSDQFNGPPNIETPLSPQERQEQFDADYAMALQMQLEEEEDQRRRRAQSQPNESSSRPNGGRRSTGNIPINLGSNPPREVRPIIPARNARSNMAAVSRPADDDDPDAPPAYEEAARTRAYNPPLGSPLHPQSSATPETSPFNSTSQLNIADNLATSPSSTPQQQSSSRPFGHNRRSSAYAENHDRLGAPRPNMGSGRYEMGMSPAYEMTDGRMPGSYVHTGHGGHGQSVNLNTNMAGGAGGSRIPGGRAAPQDRDCIVM